MMTTEYKALKVVPVSKVTVELVEAARRGEATWAMMPLYQVFHGHADHDPTAKAVEWWEKTLFGLRQSIERDVRRWLCERGLPLDQLNMVYLRERLAARQVVATLCFRDRDAALLYKLSCG